MRINDKQSTHGLLCFVAKDRINVPESRGAGQSEQYKFPEIHMNIWESQKTGRGKTKNSDSMLDIGFMFDVKDPATSIVLIFSDKVSRDSVVDLSRMMSCPRAIPAIFNESLAITANPSHGSDVVAYDPTDQREAFAVVGIEDAISETKYGDHCALHISVENLISRAREVSRSTEKDIKYVYVRFRILKFKREYYCVGAGERHIGWWQPTWQKTEDIDFRLNIRRGVPPGLENTVGSFLKFSKVHLFLMRAREKDIIFQDRLFNASRSLEDEDFWAQYICNDTTVPNDASFKRVKRSVKNSLSYHWKKTEGDAPITEFSTLARFKIVEFGLLKFVIAAILLNLVGNFLFAEATGFFDRPSSIHAVRTSVTRHNEKK